MEREGEMGKGWRVREGGRGKGHGMEGEEGGREGGRLYWWVREEREGRDRGQV